jgi:hypothetical protein
MPIAYRFVAAASASAAVVAAATKTRRSVPVAEPEAHIGGVVTVTQRRQLTTRMELVARC